MKKKKSNKAHEGKSRPTLFDLQSKYKKRPKTRQSSPREQLLFDSLLQCQEQSTLEDNHIA